MIQGIGAHLRSLYEDLEVLYRLVLPTEGVEGERAECTIDILLFCGERRLIAYVEAIEIRHEAMDVMWSEVSRGM